MRPGALLIIGAVAVSLVVSAQARPRFGPGSVLRAATAPLGIVLGAGRHAGRRHRAQHEIAARRVAQEPEQADTSGDAAQLAASKVAQPPAPTVFWPWAADDLVNYVLLTNGHQGRFWTYDYAAILQGAFLTAPEGTRRGRAGPEEPRAAASSCDGTRTNAITIDDLIEQIERAITPTEQQRGVIETVRAAVARALAQIDASCPAQPPVTPAQRLKAIESRIWAMHDALLTLRQPFEKFFGSLTDEQHWRLQKVELRRERSELTSGTDASYKIKGAREIETSEACDGQAIDIVEPLRAVARAVRPTEQQRAALEVLQMRVAGMARLIASTCPRYPLLGPMDRITAAADRLNVMLFAVMTLNPALPDFYDGLSDVQKTSLERSVRQLRRRT